MSESRKGKHHSKETKRKISESHKGKPSPCGMKGKHHSDKTRKKMSLVHKGEKHHLWGKYHPEETRKKISLALKGKRLSKEHRRNLSLAHKGKKASEETKKKISISHKGKSVKWLKGIKLSEETKKKISIANRGKKSTHWKGGTTPIDNQIRQSKKYKEWHQNIFIRDDFNCQKCGVKGGNLHAHHSKPFSELIEEIKQNLPLYPLYEGAMIYTPLWNLDNGITLCVKCHNNL